GDVSIDDVVLVDDNAVIPDGEENIGALAPGDDATIYVTHTVIVADLINGFVSNQATAEGYDPNGNPVKDESDDPNTPGVPNDPTNVYCTENPLLTVTKVISSTGPYSQVGDEITYKIVVSNTGNVTISDIVLTDNNAKIPEGKEVVGILVPGEYEVITATHAITQVDLDNGL